MELQGRVKARDERIDYNPKREFQQKKKDEQLRGKFEVLTNRIQETNKIIKEHIMSGLKAKVDLMETDFNVLKRSLDQTKSYFRTWLENIEKLVKQKSKEEESSNQEQVTALARTFQKQTIINNENIKSLRENLQEIIENRFNILENKVSVATSDNRGIVSTLRKL